MIEQIRVLSTFLVCLTIVISMTEIPISAETQVEMTVESCGELDKSVEELDKIYREILKDRTGDEQFIAAFKKAQKTWEVYRDAHLEALYPGSPEKYGSVNAMCRCVILNRMTRERIETLRYWLSGDTEGDVCAGSRMRRGNR